jgi:hypothetical protein
MHHAKNSHPEWGYLAPAPNFFRAVRIVLVATAVGATAGAGVVLSLVDRSAGQTSLAARTLVHPTQAAPTPDSAPQTAQMNAQASIQNQPTGASGTNGQAGNAAASERSADWSTQTSSIAGPIDVRALTNDTPAKAPGAPSLAAGQPPVVSMVPLQAKANKKHHVAPRYAWRGGLFGLPQGERFHAWGFSGG